MRIGPLNAWIWCDSSATNVTWKLEVSRRQPDFLAYLRGLVGHFALALVAFLFRDMPGVKGRRDTVRRMTAALAPVFDGEGVKK